MFELGPAHWLTPQVPSILGEGERLRVVRWMDGWIPSFICGERVRGACKVVASMWTETELDNNIVKSSKARRIEFANDNVRIVLYRIDFPKSRSKKLTVPVYLTRSHR